MTPRSLLKRAIPLPRLLLHGRLRRIWRTSGSPLSASPLPLPANGSRRRVLALRLPVSFAVGVRLIPASAPSVATPAFILPSTSTRRSLRRFWISHSRPWRLLLLRLTPFRMRRRTSTSLCVVLPRFRRSRVGLLFARKRRKPSPTTRFCLFATPLVASRGFMAVPRRPFVPASYVMPTLRFSRSCAHLLLLRSSSSVIRLPRFHRP